MDIVIKPEVVDPDDIEMLQDLIIAAVNDAMTQVDKETQAEMSKIKEYLEELTNPEEAIQKTKEMDWQILPL